MPRAYLLIGFAGSAIPRN